MYICAGCTGSLRYMAPEVALTRPYCEKVDMYSFAVVLYEVITCILPYSGHTSDDFYSDVIERNTRPELDLDCYGNKLILRPQISALITQCWDPDAGNRLSAETVLTIFKEEEIKAVKKEGGQSFLRKTVNTIFRSKRDSSI